MTFLNKHIADVVFEGCATDTGELGVKMVIFTDIDPRPTTDEGRRVLADLMRELEGYTRQHPKILQIELSRTADDESPSGGTTVPPARAPRRRTSDRTSGSR